MTHIEGSKRWWALFVLCMGSLMIVLDATIVNVALPSIKASLGFFLKTSRAFSDHSGAMVH